MYKKLAVLGVHDGSDRCAENFYVVFFKHSVFVQAYSAVEGCLSAKCEQYAVGAFFFYYFLDKQGCDRQKVYFVGKSFGCLYSSDIGIDQDSGDAFLLESLQRLRAGVVKFAGFADFQGSAPEEQYFFYRSVHSKRWILLLVDYSMLINSSNRNSVSLGPELASG